jgi:hypothetical protein
MSVEQSVEWLAEKPKFSEKTCPSGAFSTICPDPGSNPRLISSLSSFKIFPKLQGVENLPVTPPANARDDESFLVIPTHSLGFVNNEVVWTLKKSVTVLAIM